MREEKTLEELKAENARLRKLLDEVLKAYAILDSALKACPEADGDGDATVDSGAHVKKLLEKYSRL